MSRPVAMTSDLIWGICVLKVSLWILTVLFTTINNAEGAFEWIREASVILNKVSRERDRWNERFRRKRYDIRYANCGCQQKYTHMHTAVTVSLSICRSNVAEVVLHCILLMYF